MTEEYELCHINSNFDNFYLDFMKTELKHNLKFRVFYFRNRDRGLPSIDEDYLDIRLNYSTFDRFFFRKKSQKVFKDFEKYYKKTKFKMTYAHTLFSNGYISYMLYKKYKIPYIVAIRSMDLNVFFKYRPDLKKIGVEILNSASAIVFISENYKKETLNRYIPNAIKTEIFEKSFVIPNGINNFYLDNRFQQKNKPTYKKLDIITVGFVSKRKNQLKVCEALQILVDQGWNIKYRIVGKILDKQVFKKIAKYSFVEYVPFVDKTELIKLYRDSDLFVMPSKVETFGLTYVEAMTQGLPVIYSKGEGFESYFKDGEVGYAVNSEDAIEISKKILEILENYEEISKKAISSSSKFNWDEIIEKYMTLYHDIINLK